MKKTLEVEKVKDVIKILLCELNVILYHIGLCCAESKLSEFHSIMTEGCIMFYQFLLFDKCQMIRSVSRYASYQPYNTIKEVKFKKSKVLSYIANIHTFKPFFLHLLSLSSLSFSHHYYFSIFSYFFF